MAMEERYASCICSMLVNYGGAAFFDLQSPQVCSSFDCKDFNVSGPERMLPSQQYRLKADVSDRNIGFIIKLYL